MINNYETSNRLSLPLKEQVDNSVPKNRRLLPFYILSMNMPVFINKSREATNKNKDN